MPTPDDYYSTTHRLRQASDDFAIKLKAETEAICAALEHGDAVDLQPLLDKTHAAGEELHNATRQALALLLEAGRVKPPESPNDLPDAAA
jgi:hypothetical protein